MSAVRGDLSNADKGEGFSDADVRTFWCKKQRIFRNYGVSARTRGEEVEPVRTVCGQEWKLILCGRPLWIAP